MFATVLKNSCRSFSWLEKLLSKRNDALVFAHNLLLFTPFSNKKIWENEVAEAVKAVVCVRHRPQ